jgi:hypothetical protein
MEEEEELLLMGRPKVIPFSAFGNDVNNVPAGLLIDDGGVIKQARWVGNLKQNDTVDAPIALSANGLTSPWELEITAQFMGVPTSTNFICGAHNGDFDIAKNFRMQVNAGSNWIACTWRNSAGTILAALDSAPISFTDGKYHRIRVVNDGANAHLFIDDTNQKSVSLSGWSPALTSKFVCLGDIASGTYTSTRISKTKITRSGALVALYEYKNGSGSVVSDTSGNGYNATLTDASPTDFWKKDLVPWSLLS